MSKVDILRFVDNIPEAFAPKIFDGQGFVAYLNVDSNSYSVRGDNILSAGTAPNDLDALSKRIKAIDEKCNDIDGIQAQVDGIEQDIDSLQADVETLQNTGSSSSGVAIPAVDDIVYCAYDRYADNPFTPPNLKALRGRGFLEITDGLVYVDNFLDSGHLDGTSAYQKDDGRYGIFAGFGDGKIHTYDYDYRSLSSVPLNNGDFIFNKADNALYLYDASNHKFIKASGKRHYSVDMIVDYVGQSFPTVAVYSEGMRFVELPQQFCCPIFNYMGFLGDIFTEVMKMEPPGGFCFASVQSSLSDDAAIFEVIDSEDGVIVTHDLYDGDTIFNKNDGCTYLFSDNGSSKSFSVISVNPIEPVLDIVPILNIPPYPSAVGDKAITFSTEYNTPDAYLISSSDGVQWDYSTYVEVENNARYASSSNHKIYTFPSYNAMQISDVPVGASFLNKADNSLYVFDGTQFIKT